VSPGDAVARVSAATERLAELDGLEPAAHVAVLDDVHGVLQEALAELDQA
jgi:hypothetical protein